MHFCAFKFGISLLPNINCEVDFIYLSSSNSMGMVLLLIVAAAGIVSAGVKENIYGGDILT